MKPKLSIKVSSPSVTKIITTDEYADEASARANLNKLGWDIVEISPWVEPAPLPPPPEIRITTASNFAGNPGIEEIGVVTAECVFGAGPIKDISSSLRNVFGGRAEGIQKLFRDAKDIVLVEIKRDAAAMDADGIIGFDLKYDTIETNGFIMQMAYAFGTAVRFKDI